MADQRGFVLSGCLITVRGLIKPSLQTVNWLYHPRPIQLQQKIAFSCTELWANRINMFVHFCFSDNVLVILSSNLNRKQNTFLSIRNLYFHKVDNRFISLKRPRSLQCQQT